MDRDERNRIRRLFCKRKVQKSKDLYSDRISSTFGADLDVETWQDGEPDEDSDRIHTTQDIQWIDLEPLGLMATDWFMN